MADYLRKNNIMTTTNVRKLFNCGGFGLEAFFFVLTAYADNKVSSMQKITYLCDSKDVMTYMVI